MPSGPYVENHKMFPNRINMQIVRVIDRANIDIRIWERGAGYTLASGSSSCAAAAASHKLGFVDNDITVHMPGGTLRIEIGDDGRIHMTGPVEGTFEGQLPSGPAEENPKSEVRNPKQILNDQSFKDPKRDAEAGLVCDHFAFLNLFRISRTTRGNRHPPLAELSDFVLRIAGHRFSSIISRVMMTLPWSQMSQRRTTRAGRSRPVAIGPP